MYLHPLSHRLFQHVRFEAPQAAAPAWRPQADIREDGNGFRILLDVPGIDPQAIDILAEANLLTVRGERQAEPLAGEEQASHSERAAGKFERRFSLPDTADTEAITASGRHGVLEIRIPKKAVAQPRRIQVAATPIEAKPADTQVQ